jgi:hypothetical protein
MAAQYSASVARYIPLTVDEITKLSAFSSYRKPQDHATRALWEAFQDPETGEHILQSSALWKTAGNISRKVCDDLLDPIYSFKQQPHLHLACRAIEEKFPLTMWCEGHWKAEALLTTRFCEKKRGKEKKRGRKSQPAEGGADAGRKDGNRGEKRTKKENEGESLENQRARLEMEEHAARAGGVEDAWGPGQADGASIFSCPLLSFPPPQGCAILQFFYIFLIYLV